MRLIHISDLHVSSPNYMPEWGARVIKHVNSMKPDILVITGDLTMDGYMHEYELVGEYLDKFDVQNTIIVPGNHDARNEGYKIFEEIFETRYPNYEDTKVTIFGVDSSAPDIDDGHVGRENYPIITNKLAGKEKVSFLVLHHHLIPIPGTGREQHIPTDAGDVLDLCTDAQLNFVLSGHKHKPWLWMLENTYFITAGTATTRRLKGKSYPSFNIFDLNENKMRITEFNVEDEVVRDILKVISL